MRTTARAHGLLMVAALLAASYAQTPVKAPVKTPQPPAKPKLTEKQKQGLRMLDAAQTEAAALQPDMRAFIEWQVSMGYLKFDSKKSDELLESAFNSAATLSGDHDGFCWNGKNESCRVKSWLEEEILEEIIKRSPNRAAELVPKLDPEAQSMVNGRLLDIYLEKKQLDRAKEILDGASAQDGYPFQKAASLMEAIPESRQSERLAIFTQAFANYEQVNSDQFPGDWDFPSMLVRCWRQIPPATVVSAIDSILEKTKNDEDNSKYPMGISSAHHDPIRFASAYELRLFELLPIVRELDSSHADQLLRDSAAVKETLKKYPKGVLSIDENFGQQPPEKDDNLPEIDSFGFAYESPEQQRDQSEMFQQTARLYAEVADDPRKALASALSLPEVDARNHHPRISALLTVAEKTAKKNPGICSDALREARQEIHLLKPALQTQDLLEIAQRYQEISDNSNAKSVLTDAIKSVDELYAKDADTNDPNLGFKVNWPSSQFWGRCLQLAGEISPDLVEEKLAQIPDPEVLSFLKVMFANGLLRAPHPQITIAELHKDKRQYMSMR
jgi:hypothetical protein